MTSFKGTAVFCIYTKLSSRIPKWWPHRMFISSIPEDLSRGVIFLEFKNPDPACSVNSKLLLAHKNLCNTNSSLRCVTSRLWFWETTGSDYSRKPGNLLFWVEMLCSGICNFLERNINLQQLLCIGAEKMFRRGLFDRSFPVMKIEWLTSTTPICILGEQ